MNDLDNLVRQWCVDAAKDAMQNEPDVGIFANGDLADALRSLPAAAHERDVARAALDRALGELLSLKRARRDRFAAAALTGLLASVADWAVAPNNKCLSETAASLADELIAQLDNAGDKGAET